jgi:hypothetical protein
MEMTRRRFTERERADRIRHRIYDAGERGISVQELARRERVSPSRTYYYLRLIRKAQMDQGVRIRRLDRRLHYVSPIQVEPRMEPRPSTWKAPHDNATVVELHGYLNYASSQPARNIHVDCVMVVPHNRTAILAASERIKDLVEARLGSKIASMLKFGVSEATPYSDDHFLFRRHRGDWNAF